MDFSLLIDAATNRLPEHGYNKQRNDDHRYAAAAAQMEKRQLSVCSQKSHGACSDPSLLEQTQTTATAEHPSLQTFNSGFHSSFSALDNSTTVADVTGTTLSAVEVAPRKNREQLRNGLRTSVSRYVDWELNDTSYHQKIKSAHDSSDIPLPKSHAALGGRIVREEKSKIIRMPYFIPQKQRNNLCNRSEADLHINVGFSSTHRLSPKQDQKDGNLSEKVAYTPSPTETKLNLSQGQRSVKEFPFFDRSACSDQNLEKTTTADHPSLQKFDFTTDSSVPASNESTSVSDYTGTTVSVTMTPQKHREKLNNTRSKTVHSTSGDSDHQNDARHEVATKPVYNYFRSTSFDLGQRLASPEGSSVRRGGLENMQLSYSPGKRLSLSLPSNILRDYSGGNLLLNRQPGEESFLSQMSGRKLSKSLPVGGMAKYSGGNLLLKRKRSDKRFNEGKKRNVNASPINSNSNKTKPIIPIITSEGSAKPLPSRDLPKDVNQQETSLSSRNQLNTLLLPEISECSVFHHQTMSVPESKTRSLDKTGISSIFYEDLSFKRLQSSTPKRLPSSTPKRLPSSTLQRKIAYSNQENVSDIESDSDPDYVPPTDTDSEKGEDEDLSVSVVIPTKDHNDLIFESDHEEIDDEDIDNDAMEIVIGDANSLTDFTLNEYFEKYRNKSVISDEDLNDYGDMKSDKDKENEGTVGHLGFEEINRDNNRKAKKKPILWQVNKLARERGHEYTKANGSTVPARAVQAACSCSKLKCNEKYDDPTRQKIRKCLLQLASSGQDQFISNHMTINVSARPTVVNSRRTFTRKYYLPALNGRMRVCKTMFLSTLNITDKKTRILATKIIANSGVAYDNRRAENGGQNRIPKDHILYIEDHIKSFPAYTSHYGREKSTKLYLSSDLSIAKLYRMYATKCAEDNHEPVQYNSYRLIFRSFKLAFRRPSKDTCNECDKFSIRLRAESDDEKKAEIRVLRDMHQAKANSMYQQKKTDVKIAKTTPGVRTVSFDLQKCLATPHLQCGTAYYSRQLYTLNFTMFSTDCNRSVADCYLWDETKAKRGAQEIGSCVLQDLAKMDPTTEEVNYFSDRCPGQNLNFIMCCTFLKAVRDARHAGKKLIIRHKLMIPGHSHMEVDSVHAAIERAKSKTTVSIETPRDWAIFIGSIERKIPFIVTEMKQTDFVALKELEHFLKRPTKNTIGEKIRIREISLFEYRTDDPTTIRYKYDLDEDFLTMKIETATVMPILNPIATEPLPLSQEKLHDLKKLMKFVSNKEYYETFLKHLVPKKRGRRAHTTDEGDFDADLDQLSDEEMEGNIK